MTTSNTYLNGQPATSVDLAPLAFAGFAHFTAMQVRDRAVRGLDLHLNRLREASLTLFGCALPDPIILDHLGTAINAGPEDSSVTLYVTSRPGEFMPAGSDPVLDVLVRVTDPVTPPPGPLALDVVPHQRHLPAVKHVGEIAKTLYLRQARSRGFDDAAFEDEQGRLSEATIWNLAFWDGDSMIWPEADLLSGITRQILGRQLEHLGIAQRTLPVRCSRLDEGWAAVVMNSWSPGIAVSRIGAHDLSEDPTFLRLLHLAFEAEPAAPVDHG